MKLFSFNKIVTSFILFITLVSSCVSYHQANYTFNQKYPATELKEDFLLLKKILEANHPSLYWFTPKDSIDYFFSSAINSINDSLTEAQFRNKIAFVISKIKCGHTVVRYSKDFDRLVKNEKNAAFPLSIKTWKDSMVVIASAFKNDSVFKRGTIITSIDGRSNKEILDSIFTFISTDGYADNFKSQVVSNNFSGWYRNVFGLKNKYSIQYIDSTGKKSLATVYNFIPKKDTIKRKDTSVVIVQSAAPSLSKRQIKLLSKRSMNIDSSINTAYMRLTTFSGYRLRKFFRQSFRTIHQQHIKNVVIDLRENLGGNVDKSILLAKYFKDSSFKVADTIAAISRKFEYGKYIRSGFWDWFPMHFNNWKMSDRRIHNHFLETHYYHPKQNNHFNGNVYLVQGGYTFSAATMFLSWMKGQKNVQLIGEETGGGYYGNSAMFIPDIVLPNTKLRVSLPLYRVVWNDKRIKNGRGVMPDIEIDPSSQTIKKGVDVKLNYIRKMIITNNKTIIHIQ
jgi:C-terminal processing protease CtpA/Prc